MNFLFLPLFLVLNLAEAATKSYCATVDPASSAGASGFFSMTITDGIGYYDTSLDISNFNQSEKPVGCDFTNGISYHIHSYWNNASSTVSNFGPGCAAAHTGGHYDPGLACGEASQSHATDCMELKRTSTDGYSYSCDISKPFTCEVGDISGKFGNLMPSSNMVFSSSSSGTDFLTDSYGPYTAAYDTNDAPLSIMWRSVVWHCGSGERLVCANLLEVPNGASSTLTGSCTFPASSINTDDGGGGPGLYRVFLIVLAIIAGLSIAANVYLYSSTDRNPLIRSGKDLLSSSL